MNITALPDIPPYSLRKAEKEKLLDESLNRLTRHHYAQCLPYRKMMDAIGFDPGKEYHYADLMFLPVQLFGMLELSSVPRDKIVRTLTSSGTSGNARSMIFLDKENAANQTKVLSKIMSSFIGTKRSPMIIIDSESALKNRDQMPANAAAIAGFSLFGSTRIFALNNQLELNTDLLTSFIGQHKGKQILLFGFTFTVYRHFYQELFKAGLRPDLSNAVLIHGGGWKKMEGEAVSAETFKKKLEDICGIRRVYNYYGMIEQTGSIFMECEYGHLHTSVYSDVIIRRALDFSIAETGEEGIIQVLSILPLSYPGHSLLTEDKGILLGEDNCPCGRSGKYFSVQGRLENAELKGCSDTYDGKIH
jgi:phenylacetate-coenzyme A ligase PaaK-like adenylate-forming protein